MENKLKLVPSIYLYGGEVIDIDSLQNGTCEVEAKFPQNGTNETDSQLPQNEKRTFVDYAAYCETLCHSGADELLIFDLSDDDAGHETNLARIKDIADLVDIPIIAGGNVKRLEDVKKYIYAGASRAFLNMGFRSNEDMIQEASARFGKERIAVYSVRVPQREEAERWAEQGAGLLILEQTGPEREEAIDGAPAFLDVLKGLDLPVLWMSELEPECLPKFYPEIFASSKNPAQKMNSLNREPQSQAVTGSETADFAIGEIENTEANTLYGLSLAVFRDTTTPLMQYKHRFAEAGLNVFLLESPRPFSEFKKNADGLIPVIVQDYQTNEVLMLAYMNEEAFQHTLACGRMTYYSRSRQELWEKGLTSGHFQYVKSLSIDCDDDTLLAKVYQVGAACHTGHRSCFYRDLVPGADQANPLTVFDDVYRVILDRKEHPKEGSYTNYLFDKGIDKILKKVGEEATEIVIAAKNPDPKETVYEISDLLYHMMVLMAEKGISWKEVTTELARR